MRVAALLISVLLVGCSGALRDTREIPLARLSLYEQLLANAEESWIESLDAACRPYEEPADWAECHELRRSLPQAVDDHLAIRRTHLDAICVPDLESAEVRQRCRVVSNRLRDVERSVEERLREIPLWRFDDLVPPRSKKRHTA